MNMQDVLKEFMAGCQGVDDVKLLLRFLKEKGLNLNKELDYLRNVVVGYDYFDASRTWSYTNTKGDDVDEYSNEYFYFWWKIQVEWTSLYMKTFFNENGLEYYGCLVNGYENKSPEPQDVLEFREKHRLMVKQLEDEHGVDAEAFGEIPKRKEHMV